MVLVTGAFNLTLGRNLQRSKAQAGAGLKGRRQPARGSGGNYSTWQVQRAGESLS